jgi:hypothetical protein
LENTPTERGVVEVIPGGKESLLKYPSPPSRDIPLVMMMVIMEAIIIDHILQPVLVHLTTNLLKSLAWHKMIDRP